MGFESTGVSCLYSNIMKFWLFYDPKLIFLSELKLFIILHKKMKHIIRLIIS